MLIPNRPGAPSRSDFAVEDRAKAPAQIGEHAETPTAGCHLGMPVLASYLEEEPSRFDLSCEDFEKGGP